MLQNELSKRSKSQALEAEAEADATKKAYHDKEVKETTVKKDDKLDAIEGLTTKLEQATAKSATRAGWTRRRSQSRGCHAATCVVGAFKVPGRDGQAAYGTKGCVASKLAPLQGQRMSGGAAEAPLTWSLAPQVGAASLQPNELIFDPSGVGRQGGGDRW